MMQLINRDVSERSNVKILTRPESAPGGRLGPISNLPPPEWDEILTDPNETISPVRSRRGGQPDHQSASPSIVLKGGYAA